MPGFVPRLGVLQSSWFPLGLFVKTNGRAFQDRLTWNPYLLATLGRFAGNPGVKLSLNAKWRSPALQIPQRRVFQRFSREEYSNGFPHARGIGKTLMGTAELIAAAHGYRRISVIAGVGRADLRGRDVWCGQRIWSVV